MPAQAPFKPGASFDTKLSPLDEMAFRTWVQRNLIPFNPNANMSDYDMRGYYRGLQQGNPMATGTEVNPNDNQPHFTDYYKTPYHHSFSADSQWGVEGVDPVWVNDHMLANPNGTVQYDEQNPHIPFDQLIAHYLGGK